MTAPPGRLSVDTAGLRDAAGRLAAAAAAHRSGLTDPSCLSCPLTDAGLGGTPAARAVVDLAGRRVREAVAASLELARALDTAADRLTAAAAGFEALEAGAR